MSSFLKIFRSSKNPKVTPVRLGLDCFEERVVPASQVTSVLNRGVLTLTAQDAASVEKLVITNGSAPNSINVAGLDATKILNGKNVVQKLDFATVRSISIVLKGGADSVEIKGVTLPGNISINAGDGGNTINLGAGNVIKGSVSILNGSVNKDTVKVSGTQISKNLSVNQGAGADQSELNISTNSRVGGSLSVIGGAGDDAVIVDSASVGSKITYSGYAGADNFKASNLSVAGAVKISLGENNNFVSVSQSTLGSSVSILSGASSDKVILTNTVLNGMVAVRLGDGDDVVSLNGLTSKSNLSFDLGNGYNTFNLDSDGSNKGKSGSVLAGNLSVNSGTGVDHVNFGSVNPVDIGGITNIYLGKEGLLNTVYGEVCTIDDTTFRKAVTIDMGVDYTWDTLNIETRGTAANASTRFAGKLAVFTRGGDDSVTVGKYKGDSRNLVTFDVKPLFNGGSNKDDGDCLMAYNGFFNKVSLLDMSGYSVNFDIIDWPGM